MQQQQQHTQDQSEQGLAAEDAQQLRRLPADLRSQVAALQVGGTSCSCCGSHHQHPNCLSEQGLAGEDAQQLRRLPADLRSQVAALQVGFTSCSCWYLSCVTGSVSWLRA